MFAVALPASATTLVVATGSSAFNILADTTGEIAGPFPKPAPIVTSLGNGWASVAGASWIGPAANQSNRARPQTSYVGATDTYSTTFSMAGLNLATANLSGVISADDYVTVLLNGHLIFSMTSAMWNSTFTFSDLNGGDFVQGVNTLTLQITNATGGPTGVSTRLLVNADPIISGTPEPSTALPLGLALVGGILVYQRRKALTR